MLGQPKPEKPEPFEIWPENWPAWQAFMAVQTQWATSMAGLTGLDYARVRHGLRMAGIKPTKEMFENLRLIEGAALEALNAERKKNEKKS
jgi:hypothetical protein